MSNQLVFNGSGGHLQFFEVFEDRHVAHMEILPPNQIRNFGSKVIMDPYVSNLCFSTNGQWLVTVRSKYYPLVQGIRSPLFRLISDQRLKNRH